MLTVAEISLSLKKYNIHLVAGEKGLNKEITSIDVQEFALKSSRIKKGAMILTTFLGHNNDESIINHFHWYIKLGISAIGIHNVNLKEISTSLTQFANLYDLPLFFIPKEIPYHKIYNTYIKEVQLKQSNEKEVIDTLYEKMINDLILGKKTQQILKILGNYLNESIAFYDENLILQSVWYDAEKNNSSDFRKFSKEFAKKEVTTFLKIKNENISSFFINQQNSNFDCWIYPLTSSIRFFGYLIVTEVNKSNANLKKLIIKNTQNILILEAIQKNQIKDSYENRDVLLFEDILFTDLYIDMPFELFFTAVKDIDQMAIILAKDNSIIHQLYRKVRSYLQHYKCGITWIRGNEILILCSKKNKEIFKTWITELPSVFLAFSGQRDGDSIFNYKKMYEQSKLTLSIGLKSKKRISEWGNLGLNFIYNKLDNEDIRDMVKNKINKIGDEELVRTLRIFIESNYSYKMSSKIMYLHPNTIKYRIRKIESMIEEEVKVNSIGLEWLFYIKLNDFLK